MAERQASFIQASAHPADTDRLVLEGLMNPAGAPVSGAGYGVGSGTTELKVEQNGTPNMSVNVLAGHAWIDGTENAAQGTYHGYNDATKNLAISAAHATNARKDLVVAKVQDAQYSGATNAWSIVVVTGTPAASPSEPAVPANAIVLALVDVAASASSITNANITDRRRRANGLGGIAVCTSTTRPTTGLYEGLWIHEIDTDRLMYWDGAAWADGVHLKAWTAYTPTLGVWGIGNGTILGRFTRFGRHIDFEVDIVFGSTSTFGAGNPTVTVPVAADTTFNRPLSQVACSDATGPGWIAGAFEFISSTALRIVVWDTSGAYATGNFVTNALPFSWAPNDIIRIRGTYEAAA